MAIYKMVDRKTKLILEKDFGKEKELQKFIEQNIKEILNLKFIISEFTVGNFRIDTLAFDEETKSFKIIEFKNIKNHSLVDQGYTYLKILLERKVDFVLKYNEILNKNLRINDIDWSQSRIIFIAPNFTNYQINATDFKNIPIDLIKVKRYEENIYSIDSINKTSNIKIEEIDFTNNEINEVNREVKVYTEEEHVSALVEDKRELYYKLKNIILELDDIDVEPKKQYIAFKGATNIVDISIYKKEIKLYINLKKGKLKDKNQIAEDISNIGHWGNGDYRMRIRNLDDIDYAIPFIKQSLEVNKK